MVSSASTEVLMDHDQTMGDRSIRHPNLVGSVTGSLGIGIATGSSTAVVSSSTTDRPTSSPGTVEHKNYAQIEILSPDEALSRSGGRGPFQKWRVITPVGTVFMCASMLIYALIFVGGQPTYQCPNISGNKKRVPVRAFSSSSSTEFLSTSSSDIINASDASSSSSDSSRGDSSAISKLWIPCTMSEACVTTHSGEATPQRNIDYRLDPDGLHGWVSQLQIECSDPKEKAGFWSSSYFLGFGIGSLIFSSVADITGRKTIVQATKVVALLSVFGLWIVSSIGVSDGMKSLDPKFRDSMMKPLDGFEASASQPQMQPVESSYYGKNTGVDLEGYQIVSDSQLQDPWMLSFLSNLDPRKLVPSVAGRTDSSGVSTTSNGASSEKLMPVFTAPKMTLYYTIVVFCFLYGLFCPGHYMVAFVHANEMCDTGFRSQTSAVLFMFENSDYLYVLLWFYFIRSHSWFFFAMMCMRATVFFYYQLIVPESPRFLVSKEKLEKFSKARAIYKDIQVVNKREPLNESIVDDGEATTTNGDRTNTSQDDTSNNNTGNYSTSTGNSLISNARNLPPSNQQCETELQTIVDFNCLSGSGNNTSSSTKMTSDGSPGKGASSNTPSKSSKHTSPSKQSQLVRSPAQKPLLGPGPGRNQESASSTFFDRDNIHPSSGSARPSKSNFRSSSARRSAGSADFWTANCPQKISENSTFGGKSPKLRKKPSSKESSKDSKDTGTKATSATGESTGGSSSTGFDSGSICESSDEDGPTRRSNSKTAHEGNSKIQEGNSQFLSSMNASATSIGIPPRLSNNNRHSLVPYIFENEIATVKKNIEKYVENHQFNLQYTVEILTLESNGEHLESSNPIATRRDSTLSSTAENSTKNITKKRKYLRITYQEKGLFHDSFVLNERARNSVQGRLSGETRADSKTRADSNLSLETEQTTPTDTLSRNQIRTRTNTHIPLGVENNNHRSGTHGTGYTTVASHTTATSNIETVSQTTTIHERISERVIERSISVPNAAEPSPRTGPFSEIHAFLKTLWELDGRTKWHLVLLGLLWAIVNCVNWGITFSSQDLRGGVYVVFALNGIGKGVGYGTCGIIADRIGRQKGMIVAFATTGVLLATYLFFGKLPETPIWVSPIMILTTVAAAATAFGVLYLLTSELFPTKIRGTAFATSNVVGRIGGLVAPLLNTIMTSDNAILFMGGLSFIAVIVLLFIPETNGRDLDEEPEEEVLATRLSRTISRSISDTINAGRLSSVGRLTSSSARARRSTTGRRDTIDEHDEYDTRRDSIDTSIDNVREISRMERLSLEDTHDSRMENGGLRRPVSMDDLASIRNNIEAAARRESNENRSPLLGFHDIHDPSKGLVKTQ